MDEQSMQVIASPERMSQLCPEDQAQLVLAQLMEGGQEDADTCEALDKLTKLLDAEDATSGKKTPVCNVMDDVCVDTVLGYLDMRQADSVRAHATLTTAAYLKAAGRAGNRILQQFFFERIKRGTYDDYIVAFCVAAAVFEIPGIAREATVEMFLSEGFLPSLDSLMRRKWKSRKVETACLEMLNAFAMHINCREPIEKYCKDWLEEIVDQDPEALAKAVHSADPSVHSEGSVALKRHSQEVRNLATVVLAKIAAVPSAQQRTDGTTGRIQPATTSIEDLSKQLSSMLLTDPENNKRHSVEGLAYATIQPAIQEQVSQNRALLESLVKVLKDSPAKSPLTYGALSVFMNLTRYQPVLSEEEKKMRQLKAYASASGKLAEPDALSDNEHVSQRCQRVFEANVVPVLVTHSRHGSVASLSIIVSIISALSVTASRRGQLAQQGAVNLLIAAWTALPEAEAQGRRAAAQALARILISTNPALIFGGTRARPQNAAIRPLVSILPPDPAAAETRDLLPTFEALMALTNLASTDDDTRATILRTAWPRVEEQLLADNHRVSQAAVELVCNLVQCAEGVALYAGGDGDVGDPQAANRLHVLCALADAEDEGTRSAAGGALAALTAHEGVVRGVVRRRPRGVDVVLGLCAEPSEDLRHRGAVAAYNMAACEDREAGRLARQAMRERRGVEVLKECAKQSRRAEVVEVAVQALKILLEAEVEEVD
ncbi:myosin-binding striated muscle assembly central-domain-containing protein [Xylariaceae sp. FL0804]|nr:myosin-binding striated muscle assembly central-domain-containing protein [Xylariaceae sp. FL0804]